MAKNTNDLIQEFKEKWVEMDMKEGAFVETFNRFGVPSSLFVNTCLIRRLRHQTIFFTQLLDSYLMKLQIWGYESEVGLECEDQMYRKIKLLCAEGYLPRQYYDLASHLQRDAQPVKGKISQFFQVIGSMIEASTIPQQPYTLSPVMEEVSKIVFQNNSRQESHFIDRWTTLKKDYISFHTEISQKNQNWAQARCQPDPDDTPNYATFKRNLLRFVMNEPQLKLYPRSQSAPRDFATRAKDAANRQNGRHTCQPECAHGTQSGNRPEGWRAPEWAQERAREFEQPTRGRPAREWPASTSDYYY